MKSAVYVPVFVYLFIIYIYNIVCVRFKWYISNKLYETYKKFFSKSTKKNSVISVSLIFHGVGQMSKFAFFWLEGWQDD